MASATEKEFNLVVYLIEPRIIRDFFIGRIFFFLFSTITYDNWRLAKKKNTFKQTTLKCKQNTAEYCCTRGLAAG